MGRIKPPSGKIFRRESKPGYMAERDVYKGKNWNLQLDDTLAILDGAQKLYSSPLLRDTIGGIGELFAGGDDEPTVADAAAARVGPDPKIPEGGEATTPPPVEQEIISPQVQALQPKYDPFTAPRDYIDAYGQDYYQKPAAGTKQDLSEYDKAAAQLATAQLQEQEIQKDPTAILAMPEPPMLLKDGNVRGSTRLTDAARSVETLDPTESSDIDKIVHYAGALEQELDAAMTILAKHDAGDGVALDDEQLQDLTRYRDELINQIEGIYERADQLKDPRKPVDIRPDIAPTTAPIVEGVNIRRDAIVKAIVADPQKYLGGLSNPDRARFDAFYQVPDLQPKNARDILLKQAATALKAQEQQQQMLDANVAKRMGAATGAALGSIQVPPAPAPAAEPQFDVAPPSEEPQPQFDVVAPPAEETPVTPAATPVAAPTDVTRREGYVPTPTEIITPAVQRQMGRHLMSLGVTDPIKVRQHLEDIAQDPNTWTLLQDTTQEELPEFLSRLVKIREELESQLPSAATPAVPTAPTADVSGLKIKDGMNLGQAQAVAAQLAMSGGSQAQLAELLKDVGNITGVSSHSGGFGRWVSGGRPGGYFMDPGLAAQHVAKAYNAALAAQRSGRSKALMDAYRGVKMQQAQQSMLKQLADMEHKRIKAASDLEAKKVSTAKKRQKMYQDAIKFNYMFPVDLYKKWLDASDKAYDLGKEASKKSGGKGSGIRRQTLDRYQLQLNSSAESFDKFLRSTLGRNDSGAAAIDRAMANVDGGRDIDVGGLTDEEVVKFFGSDLNAYRRALREGSLTDQDKTKFKEALTSRKAKLTARNKRLRAMGSKISKLTKDIKAYLGDPKKREEQKADLDRMNEELRVLKEEMSKELSN